MASLQRDLSKLFFALADALNSMDDGEFDLLMEGKAKLRVVSPKNSKKGKTQESLESETQLPEIAKLLNEAESRDAAEEILSSLTVPRKKAFLLDLARLCSVHVGPRDSISLIERQLVENIVGARLASEAFKKVAL